MLAKSEANDDGNVRKRNCRRATSAKSVCAGLPLAIQNDAKNAASGLVCTMPRKIQWHWDLEAPMSIRLADNFVNGSKP